MKAKSNKSASKSTKSSSNKVMPSKDMVSKARFSVEEIENGFIIEKSWQDKDGNYKQSKKYSDTNPLDAE